MPMHERRRLDAEFPILRVLRCMKLELGPLQAEEWAQLCAALEEACGQRRESAQRAGQLLLQSELDWAYAQFVANDLEVPPDTGKCLPPELLPTDTAFQRTPELRILRRLQAIVEADDPANSAGVAQIVHGQEEMLKHLRLLAGLLRQMRTQRHELREYRARIKEHCQLRGLTCERLAQLPE